MTAIEFRVLGPLEIREGDQSLPLGGAKQRAVLALLLLHANRVVSRERLIDELWADEPPETAVTSVQVYVSRLRKVLPTGTLWTRSPGYELEVEPEDVDLLRFERLFAEARKADPERASRLLREALALWRGQALAEFVEPFAQVEGARLEDLRLAAIEERIDADLALGRHADLIGELEALVTDNPHRERLRGQLMLALYRSGRQAEALDTYRQARAALDELGIEPSSDLRQLEKAILTQDRALERPHVRVVETVTLPGPLAVSPPFPFVGRSRELAALHELLALAERGEGGRVALIGGEPGSGKTRLVRELAHEAAEGGTLVLYGTSGAIVNSPYRPFVELLEFLLRVSDAEALEECLGHVGGELTRLLPDLALRVGPLPDPVKADPETERARLHQAVSELLLRVSRRRPTLVVLDDLHWADTASLHLFRHLARALPEGRVLLVGTYRCRSEDVGTDFSDALSDLFRIDEVTRFGLEGLTAEEVAEFIRRLAGVKAGGELSSVANAIGELTDGIPFLVCELWRALVDAGTLEISEGGIRLARPIAEFGSPESVREVVRFRLSRLAAATTEMLEVAAVVGPSFQLRVLEEASQNAAVASALEEALRSGMIEEIPGLGLEHRFTHELVRRALYDRLTGMRRTELHLCVGEALERMHAENPAPVLPELAHHFAIAAPLAGTERAVDYNLRAADAAIAALAYEETATRLSTALELGIPDLAERARVQLELAKALWIVGEHERVDGVLAEALDNARAAGDERMEWYIRLDQAGRRHDAEPHELELLAREAVQVFDRLGDASGLTRASLRIAVAANRRCAFIEAVRESEQALVHATAIGDRQEEARIVDALCTALLYGPTPAATGIARCRELLDCARGNLLLEANVLSSLAGLEAMTGHVDDARETYERARMLYAELAVQPLLGGLTAISGWIELLAGDAEAAERELRFGIGLLTDGPFHDAVAHRSALLALALLAQGRREDAAAALADTEPIKLMTRIVRGIAVARVHSDVEIARQTVDLAAATDALNLRADAHAALADLLAAQRSDAATPEGRIAFELYKQKGNELAAQKLSDAAAPV